MDAAVSGEPALIYTIKSSLMLENMAVFGHIETYKGFQWQEERRKRTCWLEAFVRDRTVKPP